MPPETNEIIGVMGAGVVGGSLADYLSAQGHDVRLYDPPKDHDDISVLDDAPIMFICVPTPYTLRRGYDDRYLLAAVAAVPGAKTVVIKSTSLPGTARLLQEHHPQHRFMFNPEFLREATAFEDFIRPDRQIVGYVDESKSEAEHVMSLLPRAPFELICPAEEAEMAKYVANSFLAVKVSYANEIFDLCTKMRVDYSRVRDIVAADARIGASHMDVFDSGYRGYAGKCLPKDSKSLLDLGASYGVELDVLRAADRVNAAFSAARPPSLADRLAESADEDVADERAQAA
jgi:UDPglucose 6-dehydrogenase